MAWGAASGVGVDGNKTSQSSFTTAAGTLFNASVPVGAVLRVVVATDNIATTSGATNTHTGVTDSKGNTYTKLIERTFSPTGAAGDGATVSVWVAQVANALTNADNLTVTFSGNVAAKNVLAQYRTVGAGNTWQLDGANGAQGTGTTPSVTLSGLSAVQRLWIGALAAEGTATVTEDADYANLQTRVTSGGGTASNMRGHSASRVATLTGDTYNPTLSATSDWAAVLVALREVAGGQSYSQTAAATATFSGSLARSSARVVSLGASLVVTLARATSVLRGAATALGASLARTVSIVRSVGATVAASATKASARALGATSALVASLSSTRVASVLLEAGAALGTALARSVPIVRAAQVTLGAALAKATGRAHAAATAAAADLRRSTARTLASAMTASAGLTRASVRVLGQGVGLVAALARRVGRELAAGVASAPALARRAAKALATSLGVAAALRRSTALSRQVSVSLAAALGRGRRLVLAAATSLAAGIQAFLAGMAGRLPEIPGRVRMWRRALGSRLRGEASVRSDGETGVR